PAADRRSAGAIKQSAMTSNGFVGNRRYNSAFSVHQMHVQSSESSSFAHALSGNPDEDLTGPPTLRHVAQGRDEQSRTTINTVGGDGPGISSFGLSIHRFYLLLFLWLFVPGQTFSAESQNLTVVSYPARPAKLPLWLAQDAGLFERN